MKLLLASIKSLSRYLILNNLLSETPNHIQTFNFRGQEYGFIPDLDEMSLGEYIDLDNNISKWKTMHNAMNVLYRPINNKVKGKYNITEYNTDNPDKMIDMPLAPVLSSMFFFLQFRDRIVQTYDSLFASTGGGTFTKEAQFGQKWGWYSSLYALAGGDITRLEDITKLKIHQCFTMLSFEKEKSEMEAQNIKSKF